MGIFNALRNAPTGVQNQMYGQPSRVPGYSQGLGQAPGQMALPPEPMPIGRPTAVVGGPAYFTPQGYNAPPQPTEAFMPTDVRPDPIGQQFMRQMQSPMGQQFQAQYEATQAPMRARETELRDAQRARQDQRFQEMMDRVAELEGQLSARQEAATIPPPQIPYVPGGPFIPGLPDFSDFDFSQIDFSNLPGNLDLGDVQVDVPEMQKSLRTFLKVPEPTAPINTEEIIRNVQSQLKIPERFDPTKIQREIEQLKARPVFEPQELDREALARDIQSRIKLPEIPTGRDFSVDREALIRDIREGIEIPKYEMPDLSQFARLEDIPKPPSIDRQALIEDIRSGIELPTYQAPDLSGFARLEDIPRFDPTALQGKISGLQQQIAGLPQPQQIDVESLRSDILGRVPQFDSSSLQREISQLRSQIGNIPSPQQSIDVEALKRDILSSIPQQQSIPSIPRINLPSIIR